MKTERLLEIALDLQNDMRETNVVSLFEQLVNALQNQINGPNPQHLDQISSYRQQIEANSKNRE